MQFIRTFGIIVINTDSEKGELYSRIFHALNGDWDLNEFRSNNAQYPKLKYLE